MGARRVSLLRRECTHPLGSRQPRDLSDLASKEREREGGFVCVYVYTSPYTTEQTQNLPRSKALAREIQLLLNFSTGDSLPATRLYIYYCKHSVSKIGQRDILRLPRLPRRYIRDYN